MGFFTKAVVQALQDVPSVNAEIDGTDLIYKNYYHIGVAVGTDKGLVVPVVRDCDQKSIAEIEKSIADFGRRAPRRPAQDRRDAGRHLHHHQTRHLRSLMSTPILNAPQVGHSRHAQDSGASGRDRRQGRGPSMMYLAVSYDHRVIDGKEAVTFLVRVKESLEIRRGWVLDL